MASLLWQHVFTILILINSDAIPEEFPIIVAILEWFHFCGELLPLLDISFLLRFICLLF